MLSRSHLDRPAFPRPASEYTASGSLHEGDVPVEAQEGMGLRDYFAAHAPEASDEWIKAQGEVDRLRNPHGDSYKPARRTVTELRAAWRYEYADAMLAQRERRP